MSSTPTYHIALTAKLYNITTSACLRDYFLYQWTIVIFFSYLLLTSFYMPFDQFTTLLAKWHIGLSVHSSFTTKCIGTYRL